MKKPGTEMCAGFGCVRDLTLRHPCSERWHTSFTFLTTLARIGMLLKSASAIFRGYPMVMWLLSIQTFRWQVAEAT